MGWFYSGGKRIERWLDRPGVERFMDAATAWWLVIAAIWCAVAVGFLLVSLVEAVA